MALSNEFYHHLYNLVDRGGETWYITVKDDDPDLIWCNKYAKTFMREKKVELTDDEFKATVRYHLHRGLVPKYKISQAMHIKYQLFVQRIKRLGLDKEIDEYNGLSYAVVRVRSDGTAYAAKNVSVLRHNNMHRGYIEPLAEYMTKHPDSFDVREVLKHEFIRVA